MSTRPPHHELLTTRRDFLTRAGGGFGALAFASLLAREGLAAPQHLNTSTPQRLNPLAPKTPQLPARAKSVIFLFMEGGPSHIDTFDPKPLLNRLAGQQLPE